MVNFGLHGLPTLFGTVIDNELFKMDKRDRETAGMSDTEKVNYDLINQMIEDERKRKEKESEEPPITLYFMMFLGVFLVATILGR